MPGLFDTLMSGGFDDTEPGRNAQLALAAGLLGGRGSFGSILGSSLMGAQDTYRQGRKDQLGAQMTAAQLRKLKADEDAAAAELAMQQRMQQAARDSMMSPESQAMLAGGGPTNTAASMLPAARAAGPQFDQAGFINRLMQIDPLKAMAMRSGMQKEGFTLTPGAVRYDAGGRQVAAAPMKSEKDANSITEYEYAKRGGYKGSYEQWMNLKTPKTVVNVGDKTGSKYGETFGTDFAKSDIALRQAALAAPELAVRGQTVLKLLDEGKAVTGALADIRLLAQKGLSLIGVESSGDSARDTELLGMELARMTLAHVKSSGLGTGSGFSSTDRDFVERAAAGKISFEEKSLRRAAELMMRAATLSAQEWNKRAPNIPKDVVQAVGLDITPVVVEDAMAKERRYQEWKAKQR